MSIRVFVGVSANQEDAESQAVLEYTLRKHSSQEIDLTWMHLSKDPASHFYSHGEQGWNTSNWATPFSGVRWAIPEICNFQGKAIYMDSDMIVMKDIAELWNQEFLPGKIILGKASGGWRYCVSVWDCAAAKGHLPPLYRIQSNPNSHRSLCNYLAEHTELVQPFVGNWNCLDGESYPSLYDPKIRIIHYTDMSCQPHFQRAQARLATVKRKHWFDGPTREHPRKDLQQLFDKLLAEAEANGYPISKYTQEPLFGTYNKRSLAGLKATATV
jgi:hypothetical protein